MRRFEALIKTVILVWLFTMANESFVRSREKSDIERWVEEAEETPESVDNYTTVFYRQVQVKGELREKETMYLKFKKPFNVYLKQLFLHEIQPPRHYGNRDRIHHKNHWRGISEWDRAR
jgi:predicted aminopeptidase